MLLAAYTKKVAMRALGMAVDPRLRFLITPALCALERDDVAAAGRWLDRTIKNEAAKWAAKSRF